MKKRILAILLTIAMCISILPMMAFADTKVAYAILNGNTLTFYYGESKPEGAYDVPNFSRIIYLSDIPWCEQTNVIEKAVFDSSFKAYKPTSTSHWFYQFENLTKIENLDYLDTSSVTDMGCMFEFCEKLTTLDVSNWDTSSVTNMGGMFEGCENLKTLDVSNWDISSVNNMNSTFYSCGNLKTLDVSNWDTSSVNNMYTTFYYCSNLKTLDVSNWDTSSVTNMGGMFCGCSGLESIDVSKFDTSNVTDMRYMFCFCSGLESIDVSKWDTSSVADMRYMFYCSGLASIDVSKFDTSNVTDMRCMFGGCSGLESIDVSKWDTSSVKGMSSMFKYCSNLSTLDLSSFDTSSVIYDSDIDYYGISSMFYKCSNLKTVYVSDKWQLSDDVVNKSVNVFVDCTNLIGENGTAYSSEHIDTDYAHIDDGESNPGYFTLKRYHLSFEGGEGATGTAPSPIEGDFMDFVTLPENTFIREGYKFIGWLDGENVYVVGNVYIIPKKDVTFTAKWEICNHENTEIKNAKAATISTEGYTGDTYCTDCGKKVKDGEAIPTLTPAPTPTPGGDDPVPSGEPTPTTNPTPSGNPTPTTAPVPTKDPNLDVGDFVDRCYDVALGREADEAGYDSWKSQLNNGQACGAQVGYGFIFSPEYILKDTSNEQYVRDLYTMFFDREPDEAGFAYWVDQLNAGTAGREQVFAGFANSVEFYELCLKYGVVAGYYVVGVNNEQQGGVNSFVARLYKVCLNRMPDQGGQAGWVIKLMNGEVTGTSCAYGFVFSPEFTNLNLDNSDFVKYMYKAFFGREADEEGLNYWVGKLDNGTATREDIFAGFSGSAEFANLCAGYGINA